MTAGAVVAIDLGTGDGRYVLRAAVARPHSFYVGVDADRSRMVESSRRAPKNALFVWAAAETPPLELAGRASALTVHFPWGSLLRGVLGADAAALDGIASFLAPGAELRALVSATKRDRRDGLPCPPDRAALARPYAAAGLDLIEVRPATTAEVAASHSSWAKRLGTHRPVTVIRAMYG